MQHGKGVLTFADGSQYEGEWRDNTIAGQGTLTFWDGKKYRGEWKDDKFDVLDIL